MKSLESICRKSACPKKEGAEIQLPQSYRGDIIQ
jgi:hypothetical protein